MKDIFYTEWNLHQGAEKYFQLPAAFKEKAFQDF
jgi:hypothetical protein